MSPSRLSAPRGGRLLAAVLAAALAACSSPAERATITALELAPAATTLAGGEAVQLVATARYSDGKAFDVAKRATWSSSLPAVVAVSAAGKATATAPLLTQTATLTAIFGGFSATAQVTVEGSQAVRSLSLAPATTSVAVGGQVQLELTAHLAGGTSVVVPSGATWSSSAGAVATVSDTGLVRALAPGDTTITAAFGGRAAIARVTVTGAALDSLTVTPAAATLALGQTVLLAVRANFSDGTSAPLPGGLTFVSSNPLAAAVNAASGLVAAIAPGQSTIQVTHAASGRTASATVTVTAAVLTSIAIAPATPAVPVGRTVTLAATGTWSDGTTGAVPGLAWASSDTALATVSAAGVATGVAAGTATITARDPATAIEGTVDLTVTDAVLDAVSIAAGPRTVAKGLTLALQARGSFSDGTAAALTTGVTWVSLGAGVATVDQAGLVSALAPGTATIRATDTASGLAGETVVTVTDALLTSITVGPAAPSVAAGLTLQLEAVGGFSDGTTAPLSGLTWTSLAPAVATVADGLVTGVAPGSAVIRAQDGASGVAGTVAVAVTGAVLQGLAIAPASPVVKEGATIALAATGSFSDGTTAPVAAGLTWASADPAVAAVSAAGVVTGVLAGTTTVTATSAAGPVAAVTVTVEAAAPPLVAVEVVPNLAVLYAAQTLALDAFARFEDGSALPATPAWASVDELVATVSAAGVVTGVAPGSTFVTATQQGVAGQADLLVAGPSFALAALPATVDVPGFQVAFLRLTGLAPGAAYEVRTAGAPVSGDVDLIVARDGAFAHVACLTFLPGPDEACAAIADARGELYAALVAITFEDAQVAVSATPVPPAAVAATVAFPAGLPIQGSAGAAPPFTAAYAVTGLVPGGAYEVSVSASDDLDLFVYRDAALARFTCRAANPVQLGDPLPVLEGCTAQASEAGGLWVVVDGQFAAGGTPFTLDLVSLVPAVSATVAVPADLPARGIVQGADYLEITGLVPGAAYDLSAASGAGGVDLAVYAGPGFDALLCAAPAAGTSASCPARAGGDGRLWVALTRVLDGPASYVLAIAPRTAPALTGTLLATPFDGTVAAGGVALYRVRGLSPEALYTVSASGGPVASAYSDAAFADRSCAPTSGEGCLARASLAGDLFVRVDGAGAGGAFTLAVDPVEVVPSDATFELPLPGALSGNARVHWLSGLLPGDVVRIRLGSVAGDLQLAVGSDQNLLEVACTSSSGTGDEACVSAVGPTGMLWVLVDGTTAAGASSYVLEVSPLAVVTPLAPADLPQVSAVDTGQAFFELTGLTPASQVRVQTTAAKDVGLLVFSDPAFTTFRCASDASGTGDEACVATVPASGELYVIVDGRWTVDGATFTLDAR